MNLRITGGIDIGNGYTKAKITVGSDTEHPHIIDMPSCISYVSPTSWIPTEPSDAYLSDFVNELDVDMATEAIPASERARLLFGRRAVAFSDTPIYFNLDDREPKCDDPLSVELVLGIIAGTAVRHIWEKQHRLPTTEVNVNAVIGLALPIADFVDCRTRYAKLFRDCDHKVYVHNFANDIVVNIHFDDVTVLAEGAAAQYAITDLGAPFLDRCIAAARKSGVPIEADVTGAELVACENTIGVDIGEGTVNFPVFRNGHVSVESSSSINKGYGTVLDNVVAATRNSRYALRSRKELAEFMLKEHPSGTHAKLQARLRSLIDAEVRTFARDVVNEYKRVHARTHLMADVVYVYGGGANSVRDILYPRLVEASTMDEDIVTPVVYLDSSYSRDLNRNGLYMVARISERRLRSA